jgi:hypothetical protein
MHPTAHIYFSAAHSEYVIAPNSYTSDGVLFQDDTASARPLNSPAKSLGKQIKYALAHCKPVEKSESETQTEWGGSRMPLYEYLPPGRWMSFTSLIIRWQCIVKIKNSGLGPPIAKESTLSLDQLTGTVRMKLSGEPYSSCGRK